MKYSALFTAVFLACLKSFGQSTTPTLPKVLPPSPEAQSLFKYAEYPVSHSTGIPNISIPIATVRSGSLSLPINLSYHSGGFKVSEVPSVVGLGWTLNSGGAVSRTVKDYPDEGGQGYLNVTHYTAAQISAMTQDYQTREFLREMTDGPYDNESDRYFYNVSDAISGQFMYNTANVITENSFTNNAITRNLGDDTFKIIDEKGVQYFFTVKDKTREDNAGIFTSSWLLSKIRSASGKDSITFEYSYTNSFYQDNYTSYSMMPTFSADNQMLVSTTATKYDGYTLLDNIKFSNGIVRFSYGGDRTDMRKYKLNSITLLSLEGTAETQLRKFQLIYDYFVSTNPTSTPGVNKRLKLTELRTYDRDNVYQNSHNFYYNESEALPSYYDYNYQAGTSAPTPSLGVDYWGYYNGQLNWHLIPSLPAGAANREPSEQYAKAGILQKIRFPTGGTTEFEYESNRILEGSGSSSPKIVGGVRIRKITTKDSPNGAAMVKSYVYENGQLITQGINYPASYVYMQEILRNISSAGDLCHWLDEGHDNYVSNSVVPLSLHSGCPVVYPQVTEFQEGQGGLKLKTDYLYDAGMDREYNISFPRLADVYYAERPWDRGNLWTTTYYAYVNGAYRKTKYVLNGYETFKTAPLNVGLGLATRVLYGPHNGCIDGNFPTSFYWYDLITDTGVKKPSYQSEQVFEGTDSSTMVTVTFYDNQAHLKPTRTQTYTSIGDSLLTATKYTADFATTSTDAIGKGIANMKAKNIILPVETSSYKVSSAGTNKRLISAQLFAYNQTKPVPDSLFSVDTKVPITNFVTAKVQGGSFVKDSRYTRKVQFELYDDFGNVLQQRKANDAIASYVWGYNKQYPIAETNNAASKNIWFENFEEGAGNSARDDSRTGHYSKTGGYNYGLSNLTQGKYTLSYWSKQGGKWTLVTQDDIQVNTTYNINISAAYQVDDVRFYPQDAQMTTYTYDPLIGMTSSTDAKGMVTFYEYDGFQRLKNIKDQNGNVSKTINYHYKGQ